MLGAVHSITNTHVCVHTQEYLQIRARKYYSFMDKTIFGELVSWFRGFKSLVTQMTRAQWSSPEPTKIETNG